MFTDPFELFNSLFGDFHRAFGDDPFFTNAHQPNHSPFGPMFGGGPMRGGTFDSMFGRDPFGGSPFGPFGGMMGGPMITNGGFGGQSGTFSSSSTSFGQMGQGGRWVSQSHVTRTINGRTETIIKKLDAEVSLFVLGHDIVAC